MKLITYKSVFALLLAVIMVATLVACSIEPNGEEAQKPVKATSFLNPLPMPDVPNQSAYEPEALLHELAMQKSEINPEAMGWLRVTNTSIDEQVMFHPSLDDKFYYLRRGFDERYSWEGSYFVDYRTQFGEGREGLPPNIVVYGHSMEDDPTAPLFSQLKKLRDPVFAQANPYVYFSTTQEDMTWEVFSVFVSTTQFLYNIPNPDTATFQNILDGARARSLYSYEEVAVTTEDTIITLSTCIYDVNGEKLGYPNKYRYVVMARLVPKEEALKEEAIIVENAEVVAP